MKNTGKVKLFALIVFILPLVTQLLVAEEERPLVVGVLSDFQPHYMQQASGEPGGFAVALFDEIAREAGIKYRYRMLKDWDAMLTSLRIGEIDIIPNLGITPSREKDFSFTRPVEKFSLGLFIRRSSQGLDGLASMSGKTVAAVAHNAGVKLLARYPDIKTRVFSYAEEALFSLFTGEVDGFVYPVPIVEKMFQHYQVSDEIIQTGPPVLEIKRALAVRHGQKELLSRLDKAVARVMSKPVFQAIRQRWLEDGNIAGKQFSADTGMDWIRNGIILVLILAALAALKYRNSALIPGILGTNTSQRTVALVAIPLITGLLVLLLFKTEDQTTSSVPRISVVHLSKVDASTYAGFLVEMKKLGYQQGVNVEYIYKGPANSIDRLDSLIQSHLVDKPDLVLVSSTPGTLAVKRLTQGMNITVVFAPVNDPVDAGIVNDAQQPGGYITGVRLPTGDDLRLQWLRNIAPQVSRVYVPYTDGDKSAAVTLSNIKPVARQLGLELIIKPITAEDTIDGQSSVVPGDVDAIFLPRDSTLEARVEEFITLSEQRDLPLCAPSAKQVYAGALFSYGFVHFEIGRQSAQIVDQVLRGAHAGDLPVLTAENQMLINMETAQKIGLSIPPEVLSQADRLIRE